MNVNLNHIIDQVVKDKGIDRAVLVEALEAAVLSAANKKYRNTRDLEAHFNDDLGEVEVFEKRPGSSTETRESRFGGRQRTAMRVRLTPHGLHGKQRHGPQHREGQPGHEAPSSANPAAYGAMNGGD